MSTKRCLFCDKPSEKRGVCNNHYQTMRRAGRLGELSLAPPKESDREGWLHRHASHEGCACLAWPFSTSKGYGMTTFRGGQMAAHRAMCILAHGAPPFPNAQAAHSCGNGAQACVNPKHLYWATSKQNVADQVTHGTRARGRKVVGSRLTEELVLQVFADRRPSQTVARDYGVSSASIKNIRSGFTWGWLTGKPKSRTKRDKLTDDQRQRIRSDNRKGAVIAREYGVSQATVSTIRRAAA